MLFQRGLEKLADHAGIEKVDSDVDPAANLIYGTDFDLGDLCTYKYSDVNIECSKRITEIQEVLEGSKRTLSVIFGNDTVTVSQLAFRLLLLVAAETQVLASCLGNGSRAISLMI